MDYRPSASTKVHYSAHKQKDLWNGHFFQFMLELVEGWCWDDIVRQCVPDLSGGGGGNWKGSASDSWQFGGR